MYVGLRRKIGKYVSCETAYAYSTRQNIAFREKESPEMGTEFAKLIISTISSKLDMLLFGSYAAH